MYGSIYQYVYLLLSRVISDFDIKDHSFRTDIIYIMMIINKNQIGKAIYSSKCYIPSMLRLLNKFN